MACRPIFNIARGRRLPAGAGRMRRIRALRCSSVATSICICMLACGQAFLAHALTVAAGVPTGGLEFLRHIDIRSEEDGSEFRLSLRARARDASWEVEGKEAAALSLSVDGRYDHHVFLVRGPEESVYESLVGPLAKGDHRIRIEWDRSWAPALDAPPEIFDIQITPLDRTASKDEQILRAPIIYLRSDTIGRFSDVPLLLYWDVAREAGAVATVYTVIYSNEDGGTSTSRLMARWGRTTDIEWCYAYAYTDGLLSDRFQGRDHETIPYRGRYEGWHPLLYDVTQNNNFADRPEGDAPVRVRLLPVYAGLEGRARETMMDRFPWIYPIMAKETKREQRLEDVGDPNTPKVSDHRNYAYVDFCSEQAGTVLWAEIQLRGSALWYGSDHGDPEARIGRSGCVRTSVELPPGTKPSDLKSLRIQCARAPLRKGDTPVREATARLKSISQVFLLDADYQPGPDLLARKLRHTLRPGRSYTVRFGG